MQGGPAEGAEQAHARAMAVARAAVLAAPDRPEPRFRLCRLLLEACDAEALAMLPALERIAFAPGWVEIAAALAERGHAEAARAAYGRALAADPTCLPALRGVATLHMSAKRPDQAATALGQAVALAPDDAALAFLHGRALRIAGDAAGAVRALERAVALDPARAVVWFTLGLAQQDRAAPAEAEAAFARALALDPALAESAFNLGIARQEQGRIDEALDAYAHAYRLRPGSLGRIAQAMVSAPTGRLWLRPEDLRRTLVARGG